MKNDLIELKGNSIFNKVRVFFKKLFFKNTEEQFENTNMIKKDILEKTVSLNVKEEKTIDFCQGINKEMLDLQKKFHSGEVKSSELSPEQIRELINLYNKQNKQLEKSNELKKQKFLKYREKMKLA